MAELGYAGPESCLAAAGSAGGRMSGLTTLPTVAVARTPCRARRRGSPTSAAGRCRWSTPAPGCWPSTPPYATQSGIFDVSHLGKARWPGPGRRDFLNPCLTANLDKIRSGQAQYTLICNDDGGVVDDLIAYLRSEEDVLLVPNAANCATVVARWPHAAPPASRGDQPASRLRSDGGARHRVG